MAGAEPSVRQTNDAVVHRVFTVAVEIADAVTLTDDPRIRANLARCQETLNEIILLIRRSELAAGDGHADR